MTELDKMVRDAVDALKENGPGVIQGDLQDWKIADGIHWVFFNIL